MDGSEDLISVLPDGVLGEIVTRLPIADAVRVQVLSTRWRHMWRSSPLNLDLPGTNYDYHHYNRRVSSILAAHPGPGRRLKLDHGRFYRTWLRSPALNGLQELEIEAGYRRNKRKDTTALRRELGLFHPFAPTLRRLSIGYHTFPSVAAAAAGLRFPQLELISFCCVDISEGTLHGVLAGCTALRTLVLDGCTGFATVRINSPTMTSFAISPAESSTTGNTYYDSDDDHYYENPKVNQTVWVTTRQVVIEDAPLLETLVPCRRSSTAESFRLIRVVSAPRLRVLGSISSAIIPMLQIGGTVFEPATRRVNHVRPGFVLREKRSLMQAVMLATALRTVKILALEDVDDVDVLTSFLRCFPCMEKLYISASRGFRSAASYDKQNPIECLEHHLKMVALDGYDGKGTHVKLAKFFVRNAKLLQLMKFRILRSYNYCQHETTDEWIADQRRQLQTRNMASEHVKFHFVCAARQYRVVYCDEDIKNLSEHIHDSSRDDPFDEWFESDKEADAI